MDDADLGPRLLELLGEPACIELLVLLELPEADRAAAIGALYRSERGQVLADLLADIEVDPDGITRLRLIGALREVLGRPVWVLPRTLASATACPAMVGA